MFRRSQWSPIGLQIGPDAIRMVQLKRTSRGWAVRNVLDEGIPTAQDGDDSAHAQEIVQAIKDARGRLGFSGKTVVSAMPCDKLDIIPMSVSAREDEDFEAALVREAGAYLSYDIGEAVIDYLPVAPEPADGAKTPAARKTLLVAARREEVDAHLALLRAAGLKPLAIDSCASALARVFRFADGGEEIHRLVVNMNEQSTSLVVLCATSVFVDRRIPWGRGDLVNRLTESLKLETARAGDLLCRTGLHSGEEKNEGDSRPADRMLETVVEIVAPELERLATEIEKVLVYFFSEMRGVQIDELCLVGLGGAVRNLDRHLEGKIGVPAAVFDPMESLGLERSKAVAESIDGWGPSLAVALGLALRGVDVLPRTAQKGMAHAAAERD